MSFSGSQSRKRSSKSSHSDLTTNTKSSPYDGDFEQKMIDSGIYPHNRASKPCNIQDIREYMARPRASLSPSQFDDERFEEFTEACERAANEAGAMADVIPVIAGGGRNKYHSVTDARFNYMSPILEDATAPKPDVYDGALPERIDPHVRHSLGRYIVPSKNMSQPAAPNFFLEGKSAGGRADVAKRQACYDGAVGARAMHSLQNYGTCEPQYDGKAYSYSNTYHNGTGTLQIYGSHPTGPQIPGGKAEYHMTQIDSYAMTGNARSFRQGATAFRNLRDLAQAQRDAIIEQANRAVRHAARDSSSTTLTDRHTSLSALHEGGSDTSADELAGEKTTIKRTKRELRPQSTHGSFTSRHTATSSSNVAPQSSARSRHTIDEPVTSRHAATRTNVALQSNAKSRHAVDDSVDESRRSTRLSRKPLGSRHAPDDGD